MLSRYVRKGLFFAIATVLGFVAALAFPTSPAHAVTLSYDGFDSVGLGDFRICHERCNGSNMVVEALPANVERWEMRAGQNIMDIESTYKFDYSGFVWRNPDSSVRMSAGYSVSPGTIRLRFPNAAQLADGSFGDVVMLISPSVRIGVDPADPGGSDDYVPNSTPFLLAVAPTGGAGGSIWINSGFLTDWDDVAGVERPGKWQTAFGGLARLPGADHVTGVVPLSDTSVTVRVCKHGTNELVYGTNERSCVVGVADIDYPDWSKPGNRDATRMHDGMEYYNGAYTEGVHLDSGFMSQAYVMKPNPGMGTGNVYQLMRDPETTLLRVVGDRIVGSHITNGQNGVHEFVHDAPTPPGVNGEYTLSLAQTSSQRSSFFIRARDEFSLSLAQSKCGVQILGGARNEHPRYNLVVGKRVAHNGQPVPHDPNQRFSFVVKVNGAERRFTLADGESRAFYDIPQGAVCEVTEMTQSGFVLNDTIIDGIRAGAQPSVNVSLQARQDKTVDVVFENEPVRSGVRVVKYDADLDRAQSGNKSRPQGDASLDGARFEVRVARGTAAVHDGTRLYQSGDVIATLTSVPFDGGHGASTAANALPYGSYELFETSSPTGYGLSSNMPKAFSIGAGDDGKVVELTVIEPVRKGPLEFDKLDVDHGVSKSQGNGSLSGAEFDVELAEGEYVFYDGHMYGRGDVVCHVVTDASGHARTGDLPYGTYLLRETKAPTGYIALAQPVRIVHRP